MCGASSGSAGVANGNCSASITGSLKFTGSDVSHFGYGILSFSFECYFRTAPGYNLLVAGEWLDPADATACRAWVQDTIAALQPFAAGRTYVNYGTADFVAEELSVGDFVLVNEPRLSSIVATTPPGGDRSLNQAVKRDIDTSRVSFERCYSQIEKGPGYLRLSNGVLRGPLVGAINLSNIVLGAFRCARVGYHVDAGHEAVGQGGQIWPGATQLGRHE